MATVIRVIKYECERDSDMHRQLGGSMAEGVHDKGHLTITIATYSSDLAPVDIDYTQEGIDSALEKVTKDGQANQ